MCSSKRMGKIRCMGMVYFIWAVLAILSFINKRSKVVTLLVAAFIACIFCFNTANPDFENYQVAYSTDKDFEVLYRLISNTFYRYGFSFEIFRTFMAVICIGLITATIFRFSPYPALTLWLYSLCLMTLDVTQFRFFIGCSIVFFAIQFLVDYQMTKSLKDAILFFSFLLLATGFHYSCILYGILGVLFVNVQKHQRVLLFFVPLCIMAILLSFNKFAALASFALPSYKVNEWVVSEKTASLRNVLRVVLSRAIPLTYSVFISFVIRKKKYAYIVGRNKNSLGINGTGSYGGFFMSQDKKRLYDLRINRCLFMCLIYICLFAVLELTVSSQYERLSRLGLLIAILLASREIFYLNSLNRVIAQFLLLLSYLAYFVAMMYFSKVNGKWLFVDVVFRQVMESNSLFGVTY